MGGTGQVPDAWDDDWENAADQKPKVEEEEIPAQSTSMTRTERLARHAETQRKLWESAYVSVMAYP
jgi:hypothetical protein